MVSNGGGRLVHVIRVDYTANQKPMDGNMIRESMDVNEDYGDQQLIECFPYRAPLIVYTMLGVLLLIMTGFLAGVVTNELLIRRHARCAVSLNRETRNEFNLKLVWFPKFLR